MFLWFFHHVFDSFDFRTMFFRDDAVCFEVVEIIEEIVFQLVFIVEIKLLCFVVFALEQQCGGEVGDDPVLRWVDGEGVFGLFFRRYSRIF